MSFFNDFLEYFKVDDINNKVSIFSVIGVGIIITGKLTIISLGETLIEIKSNKQYVTITGEGLQVKSISSGEIVLSGKLTDVKVGEQK